jgi:hypothetical protein
VGLVPLVGDTAAGGRDGIFVSYSHHDAVWAQRFRKVLKPLVRSKRLWLWVDTDIPVGDRWHPDIRRAIGRSSVALLLVSADFLDSDFIMDEELPALIRQGVRLAPVLVGDCLWEHVPELAQVEWLHKPVRDSALNLIANKPGQRDRRLREICDRLIAMTPDARESRSQDHDPPSLPADSVLGYDRSVLATDSKITYQQAINSGHDEEIPVTAVHLGVLLAEQRDPAGARDVYQWAVNSGHVTWAPMVAVYLGVLLVEQGDPVGARAAYQRAINSRHADWAPMAAVHAGLLLAQHGNPAGARDVYQWAVNNGHARWAPVATVHLGMLLAD